MTARIIASCFALCLIMLAGFSCEETEPAVIPQLRIGDFTFFEGDTDGSTFTFKITLSAASTSQVNVDYAFEDVSAIAGEDYVGNGGTLIFEPGEISLDLDVEILVDTLREGDENFQIRLSNAINATISKEVGIGTIRNDDTYFPIDDSGYSTPDNYAGMTLVWADEFEASTLNTEDWTYEIGDGCPALCGWGNNELEYYTNNLSNSYLDQGYLVIEAREESVGGRDYTSARIITRDKQSFQYGRIDIRAKLPTDRGLWPALWLLPQDEVFGGWPASGELDIMELVGQQPSHVHGTIHYGENPANHQFQGGAYTILPSLFSDEFHVFTIEWAENEIKWYVDDNLYSTKTPSDISPANWPFNEEFFFIFNVAVGGNWPGPPNESTQFPQQMIVDYVRVFQ